MTETTYLAAISGLLHDIGKFMLRAAEAGSRTWDEEAKGDFKYKHAMLSATFAEGYVPEPWRGEVSLAARNHHNPQRRQDWVITLADHLSAGERTDSVDDDVRRSHPRQLLSIFAVVEADKKRVSPQAQAEAYLPLAQLQLRRDILFPDAPLQEEGQVWEHYLEMWRSFSAAAKALKEAHEPNGDLPTYVESLLLLMQRYTWCIPSAYYGSLPDISLYDHSRMTAALAAVLANSDLGEVQLQKLAENPKTDQPLALLVGGDISGVQEFIYTITARGAASALRGRSFYLQLLTEAISRYVLRQLGLPITNLIYGGGGSFYILARAGDEGKLRHIQAKISRALLQHHRGELYVALAGEPLSGEDFFDGRISQAWDRLHGRMQEAKWHRFAELPQEDLAWLFSPQGDGGNEETQCHVCGWEHSRITEERDEAGNVVRKCPACLSYEHLGERLRKARYLLLQEVTVTPPDLGRLPSDWRAALAAFGLHADVAQSQNRLQRKAAGRQVVLALKDESLKGLQPEPQTAVGRRFLVNVTPTLTEDEHRRAKADGLSDLPRPDSVKPFDVMAWQARGIKRLGVLRVDVDDLGRLFAEGLGKQATLSRVASLSFAISLFFEGWVEFLAEAQNEADERGERLYSIYSGGDDLFFVGAWDAVVELARKVRSDLTPYAARHPGIHASAGMALIGGKYPLYQAARDAGEAEAAAKRYRRAGGWDKDAVCFLGEVQPWERFGLEEHCSGKVESVRQLAYLLAELVETRESGDNAAPKALLQALLHLYAQYKDAEEQLHRRGEDVTRLRQPQVLWGPWIPRGYYVLKRMGGSTENKAIQALADRLHEEWFRSLPWVGLAARWAELLAR